MSEPLILRCRTREALCEHVCAQLRTIYPLSDTKADAERIHIVLNSALSRMVPIVTSIRAFTPGSFDHFNTLQYATFLYIIGNEVWKIAPKDDMVDRLFGLNKCLSGLEMFPSIAMPEIFFLSHALGAVLGAASYGNRLVVFQNVTVGRVGENRPHIGANTILFPGSTVTGNSLIGEGSVLSAGVHAHNLKCPPRSLVKLSPNGAEVTRLKRDYLSNYFR